MAQGEYKGGCDQVYTVKINSINNQEEIDTSQSVEYSYIIDIAIPLNDVRSLLVHYYGTGGIDGYV